MCNENNCFVKGTSCPPECANNQKDLTFRQYFELEKQVLAKVDCDYCEEVEGICQQCDKEKQCLGALMCDLRYALFGDSNLDQAISLYNQIEERLNV